MKKLDEGFGGGGGSAKGGGGVRTVSKKDLSGHTGLAAATAGAYVDDDYDDTSSQSQVQQGVADTVWKVGCYKIK